MKAFVVVIVLALIVAAYLAGYWPEHARLLGSEKNLQMVKLQLAEAQADLRLCSLQGRLLRLIEMVTAKNYGDATALSSKFFDQVRAELMQTEKAERKAVLESVLQARDKVTAGIVKGDPGVIEVLGRARRELNQLVERLPVPSAPPAAAPTAAEPAR